jgi:hypothetical protein
MAQVLLNLSKFKNGLNFICEEKVIMCDVHAAGLRSRCYLVMARHATMG